MYQIQVSIDSDTYDYDDIRMSGLLSRALPAHRANNRHKLVLHNTALPVPVHLELQKP